MEQVTVKKYNHKGVEYLLTEEKLYKEVKFIPKVRVSIIDKIKYFLNTKKESVENGNNV